jgi:secreted PhoX family phosphatase
MPSQLSRRRFLAGSASLVGVLAALQARLTVAGTRASRFVPGPYGRLRPTADLETGLPLIYLPEGFEYRSYSWSGDPMSDGAPAPDAHDGMGVIAARGSGHDLEVTLVRNHERGFASPILAPGRYDASTPPGQAFAPGGGTTTLNFHGRRWTGAKPSLGGTIYNCAGGATPWGTWLSCEETVIDLSAKGGRRHGYVFEVRADAAGTTAKPIVGMGRMLHEAIAIDPATGIAYLTEDEPWNSGFYRYIAHDKRVGPGSYEEGGRLQAARVAGRANADLRVPAVGDVHAIEWVDVDNPDDDPGKTPAGISAITVRASGPFLQAWAQGGLVMSRGEGICHHGGKLYLVDTEAGRNAEGQPGHGEGAVWEYDPREQTLTAIFVAESQQVGDNIDNITASPRGGLLICENGDAVTDEYGTGTRLIGLTADGDSYAFAKNNIDLTLEEQVASGKRIFADYYRASEWAGACFEPGGEVLFVNIQVPGITFAIWGPWERGNL